jgi:DNA-directed RNA polymerase subunit H (RpoH/RPB5)
MSDAEIKELVEEDKISLKLLPKISFFDPICKRIGADEGDVIEILRTVISRFTDGVYQLDKFLIIGVIAAVRHILTVGASVTLESGKSDQAFERAIVEMGLNALIVVALVFAIFMSKMAHGKKV